MKVLHSICQQIWKTQQWPQDWKRSVLLPIPKKANAKECSNYCTKELLYTSKIMLKMLQARLEQYVDGELPDLQAGFRKGRETRGQIANIYLIIKKQQSCRKNIYFCLLTMPNPLTVWVTINCGKFPKEWNTRQPDLPLEKSVCRSRSNSWNQTWNNRLVPNQERSISRLYIATLLI